MPIVRLFISNVHPMLFSALWCIAIQFANAEMVAAQETSQSDPRQTPLLPASKVTTVVGGSVPTAELVGLIRQMVLASIKPVYTDEKQWNKKREVWDGVFVQVKDGKLITRKKSKLVRSGTWTRSTVRLVDPEDTLHIHFDRLETLPDGKMAFDTTVEAQMDVWGQLNEWVRDVKIVSLSGRADALVRLRIQGTVQLKINPLKFPPDVTIIPHVVDAHADLVSYRVRRVGDMGGDAAKLLGESMKAFVDELVQAENDRLVDRINRKLAQRAHKMTFSSQAWIDSKLSSTKNKK